MNEASAAFVAEIHTPNKIGVYIILVGAVVALAITGWRYVTPLSGINGSGAAELTMLGEAALVLAGVILLRNARDFWHKLFLFLCWPGALLTLLAAIFVQGWITAAFLCVCLIGVVIVTFFAASKRGA